MAPPLRLLVLPPAYPPRRGGIQRLLYRVIQHAPSFSTRVVTLSSPGAGEFDAAQPLGIRRVHCVPESGRVSLARLNAVAVREARRFTPHAVLSGHIVTAPAAWAIRKTLGARAAQYL